MTTAQIAILAILLFFNHPKLIESAKGKSNFNDSSVDDVISSAFSTSNSSLERIDRNFSSIFIVSGVIYRGYSKKSTQNCTQTGKPFKNQIISEINQNANPEYSPYNRRANPGTINANLPRRRFPRARGGYRRYNPFHNRNVGQYRKWNPNNRNQKFYRTPRPAINSNKKKEDKTKSDSSTTEEEDEKEEKKEDKKEEEEEDDDDDDKKCCSDSSSSTIFSISTKKFRVGLK